MRSLIALIIATLISPATSHAATTCRLAFEVSLTSGPSAPVTLAGFLTLAVETDGSFTGTFDQRYAAPSRLPVRGQTANGTIALAVDLGNGQQVLGTGPLENDLRGCNGRYDGAISGTASGPLDGDRGDWFGGPGFCIFARFCCDLISGTCGRFPPE